MDQDKHHEAQVLIEVLQDLKNVAESLQDINEASGRITEITTRLAMGDTDAIDAATRTMKNLKLIVYATQHAAERLTDMYPLLQARVNKIKEAD